MVYVVDNLQRTTKCTLSKIMVIARCSFSVILLPSYSTCIKHVTIIKPPRQPVQQVPHLRRSLHIGQITRELALWSCTVHWMRIRHLSPGIAILRTLVQELTVKLGRVLMEHRDQNWTRIKLGLVLNMFDHRSVPNFQHNDPCHLHRFHTVSILPPSV